MGLSSNGHELVALPIPHRDRIDRTGVARTQQPLALDAVRIHKDGDAPVVQLETLGGLREAIAEPDALRAVDAHAQAVHDPFVAVAHIPSSPSSARALSITAGVISAIRRSLA